MDITYLLWVMTLRAHTGFTFIIVFKNNPVFYAGFYFVAFIAGPCDYCLKLNRSVGKNKEGW